MAKKPRSVEVRSYQVGFGDCFLVSFNYDATDSRHVLIDFGTTGLPRNRKGPKIHMPIIAEEIRKAVGDGELTAVIATHRHADHISGFGTDGKTGESGKVIRDLKPRLVMQPWTEDPKAQPDARSATNVKNGKPAFLATLATMNRIAGQVEKLAKDPPAWMSARAAKELSFLGEDNIANKSAIDNLIAMGARSGAKAEYLRYGSVTKLEDLLDGVKVHILGPPDLTQSDAIRSQRAVDQDEFWHLMGGAVPQRANAQLPGRSVRGKSMQVPAQARWFRDRLQSLTARGLLEIVRSLDAQMNNTSLIVLFEVNGKKMLFPGDAQLENWSYALRDAKDSARVRALLADVDFYKVGHHGSLNATPKKMLWENFTKRKGRELKSMISTMAGKHGTPPKTEVPRRPLVTALEKGSDLKNTQKLTKISDLENKFTL
jgi:Metallo-beta-lactamase superfamily